MSAVRADTIYALASASGRGGVAVLRVSGGEALSGLRALSGLSQIVPRRAQRVQLRDPVSRETLDDALALFFAGPASYTGEDVVEYHVHGGRAVVEGVLSALGRLPGYRLAGPGEFTRRAFENGKMDLTGAEAVADLIAAETEAQRGQALAQMGGALTLLYEGWRARLMRALAHMEADLDFPDEDLPDGVSEAVRPDLEGLAVQMAAHLQDSRRGERLREGIHVAVLGAPNAGKSTLVNALARREVAIVSHLAGTTRDVLEVSLDLGGYPVILSDTAGLRETSGAAEGDRHGQIEAEGIRRALARAQDADFRILVFDAQRLPDLDRQTLDLVGGDLSRCLIVFNKCEDLSGAESLPCLGGSEARPLAIVAKTGQGLEALVCALVDKIRADYVSRETPSLTRARHREAVEACHAGVVRALSASLPELVAEDLRLAARRLGQITGRVDVEDLLDIVFRDFCIGK